MATTFDNDIDQPLGSPSSPPTEDELIRLHDKFHPSRFEREVLGMPCDCGQNHPRLETLGDQARRDPLKFICFSVQLDEYAEYGDGHHPFDDIVGAAARSLKAALLAAAMADAVRTGWI